MKKGIVLFWILIFSAIVTVTALAIKLIVAEENKFHGEIAVKTDGVTHEVFEVKTLSLFLTSCQNEFMIYASTNAKKST